jgi:hypothetical protein
MILGGPQIICEFQTMRKDVSAPGGIDSRKKTDVKISLAGSFK